MFTHLLKDLDLLSNLAAVNKVSESAELSSHLGCLSASLDVLYGVCLRRLSLLEPNHDSKTVISRFTLRTSDIALPTKVGHLHS